MITEVQLRNFKSIQDLKLKLGRVTVLIGENGCGKSNILEAIALASAASTLKLDNEFLASRGVRMVEPRFMRAAFRDSVAEEDIGITITDATSTRQFILFHDKDSEYPQWEERQARERITDIFQKYGKSELERTAFVNELTLILEQIVAPPPLLIWLRTFLIYSPENSSLRTFEREGQILPLGINGEGLFKLLKTLSSENDEQSIAELKASLRLIDWFEDLRVPEDLSPHETRIHVKDRYLSDDFDYFDQRSSNEGFLFLLFYFSLFISRRTPRFFAVDNIDASLNPKLCSELIKKLVELAKKHDKQVIFTTHNPAVLDGLDLNDDEQRLLVIYRSSKGHTKARRVAAPEPISGEPPIKLSEAFLRGLIGGLPQNF
jgi:predicted ATPase